MMAKPLKTIELLYPMIQFLIKEDILNHIRDTGRCEHSYDGMCTQQTHVLAHFTAYVFFIISVY